LTQGVHSTILRNQNATNRTKGPHLPFLKLREANEPGESVGPVFVNTDQILTIAAGPAATELNMSDGKMKWVLDTPKEVVKMIN
jgi:hypothetical protein